MKSYTGDANEFETMPDKGVKDLALSMKMDLNQVLNELGTRGITTDFIISKHNVNGIFTCSINLDIYKKLKI